MDAIDARMAEFGQRLPGPVSTARSARRGGRARRPGAHTGQLPRLDWQARASGNRRYDHRDRAGNRVRTLVCRPERALAVCGVSSGVSTASSVCSRCSGSSRAHKGSRARPVGRRRREPGVLRRLRRCRSPHPIGDRRRRHCRGGGGRDRSRGRCGRESVRLREGSGEAGGSSVNCGVIEGDEPHAEPDRALPKAREGVDRRI